MKILYHHRTQAQGVEGVHIYGTINAFRQFGHQVKIISPLGILSEKQVISNTQKSVSQRIYKSISNSFPKISFEFAEIVYNIPAYFRINDIIKHEGIDFIYERYAMYCISGVMLARKLGIPVILEVNIVSDLEDVRPVKMQNLAKKFENKILSLADAIVTVSSFLKHHIIAQGIKGEKIWVIPNAVNPDEFRANNGKEIRHKYGIDDSFVIGFVGRLLPWYNLDALIESFNDIIVSGRSKVHLLLVGDGILKSELHELIQKHNLSHHVTMTGWIEHSKIPEYINTMDVAVLPNSNSWGSPMKIFEYMFMGKPVIAPAYSPIEEVIFTGKNGILFNPGNYGELKQAMFTLIDNNDLRREIGDNARETIVENHTWAKNVEKIIKIYEWIKS